MPNTDYDLRVSASVSPEYIELRTVFEPIRPDESPELVSMKLMEAGFQQSTSDPL
jgi:hypothetical protein